MMSDEFIYVADITDIEINQIYESCKIDHWFLKKIQEIVNYEILIKNCLLYTSDAADE